MVKIFDENLFIYLGEMPQTNIEVHEVCQDTLQDKEDFTKVANLRRHRKLRTKSAVARSIDALIKNYHIERQTEGAIYRRLLDYEQR